MLVVRQHVRHVDVRPAVVVDVRDIEAHGRQADVRHFLLEPLGERAVAVVEVEIVALGEVIRDVNVGPAVAVRSEEHTSELQSQSNLVCRLLLEKKRRMVRALLRPRRALRADRRRPARNPHAGSAVTGIQTTLLGQHLRILAPLFLWIAPLGLVAGALAAIRSWQRQQRVAALVAQARVDQVLRGRGATQGIAKGATLGLGLFFLFLAAAGPQCGERTEVVKRSGMDLVVALDASNSMLARDVKPSRIERAKLEVTALLDRLNGDRVGLVVFAGDAFVQCPLTTDYAAARLFLRAVEPLNMATQGTAIADALYHAREVLD